MRSFHGPLDSNHVVGGNPNTPVTDIRMHLIEHGVRIARACCEVGSQMKNGHDWPTADKAGTPHSAPTSQSAGAVEDQQARRQFYIYNPVL